LTKEDIENYLIKLLINNCYEVLKLEYKNIIVEKSESPDFIVSNNKISIGVEITRALDQNIKKVKNIRNDFFPGISFCSKSFENKAMSGKMIKDIFKRSNNKFAGGVSCYKVNQFEEKVIKDIINSIIRKNKKFNKYKSFDKNILFIHSENRVSLDFNLVAQKISIFIKTNELSFDYIFLKLGYNIYYFIDNTYKSCKIKT